MPQIPALTTFAHFFDAVATGIVVIEPFEQGIETHTDFRVLFVNSHALGDANHADYEGQAWTALFPQLSDPEICRYLNSVFQSGESSHFETIGDPSTETCYTISAVKRDSYLVVTIEDVTNKNSCTDALESAEKQTRVYESIIANTPDLVYVFDLSYNFTYANKALLAMWGKSAGEAIGKGLRENGYEEWHAQLHEREIDTIVQTKKSVRGTVAFPHAELGSRVYDYILVPVINQDGEVEAVAGTTRDITEIKNAGEKLQQSESRLKTVIEQTPAPTLVLMGDDLVIEQINLPMMQMIGQDKDVTGMPLLTLLPELSGQYIWDQVLGVYTNGTPFNHSEVLVRHSRKDGIQDYYYNLAYRPLKESGKITGMIQVAVDVTEQVTARKKLEESEGRYRELSQSLERQVTERTQELQRSNQDLQQFAHVASHDLKEPVRKIKIFAGRLDGELSGHHTERSEEFIDKIQIAADRMFSMIEGVLSYSTANAGIQVSEPVDLNDIVKQIELDLEIPLQKGGGSILYKKLPTVEGASVLLHQLFYNLINNSIKFAKKDVAPKIEISAETLQDGFTKITLRDNGIGFKPEHATRIFDTFSRLNAKDAYEGTGLGLSLCKKIVERHGGSIEAESALGNGATFVVRLPIKQHKENI